MTAATDSNWGGEGCLNYSSQNRGAGGSGGASYQGSAGSLPGTSRLQSLPQAEAGDHTPVGPWGLPFILGQAAGSCEVGSGGGREAPGG